MKINAEKKTNHSASEARISTQEERISTASPQLQLSSERATTTERLHIQHINTKTSTRKIITFTVNLKTIPKK
tara:strand:- start:555 stop:773 length:219 start_codon:yes stop_codon:yes gene_type:complete